MKKLAIVLSIFLLFLSPAQVFAMSGNATGDDNQAGTMKVEGGPTYRHTGWLIYLVDAYTGQQCSETIVYYCYEEPTECNVFYPKTRFGGSINWKSGTVGTLWDFAPFDNDANGYGDDLKNWMLTKEGKTQRIVALCEKEFGAAPTQTVINGDYLFIFEPFFWGQMYHDDLGATGIYLCATAYGWADKQLALGMEGGSKLIGRYTNDIYPNCVKLEKTLTFPKTKTGTLER